MPTTPNGIIPIYAINKLGGVASMIHPLSPPEQINMFLKISKSKYVLTLNAFYKPVAEAKNKTISHRHLHLIYRPTPQRHRAHRPCRRARLRC